MATAFARPSVDTDVLPLAHAMRSEDVAEVWAANHHTPMTALTLGLLHSDLCYTIEREGEVIGMFGVAPSGEPNVGRPWLLASPKLPEIKREFIEQTPKYIDLFHTRYPLLSNLVDERNALHIRWLKRVGFVFIKRHPHAGVEQRPFLEFVKLCVPSLQSPSLP